MRIKVFFLIISVLLVSSAIFAVNDLKWTSNIKFVGSNVAGDKYTVSAEFEYAGANPVNGYILYNGYAKQRSEFVPNRKYQYIEQNNVLPGTNSITMELCLEQGSGTDSDTSNNKVNYSFNSSNIAVIPGVVKVAAMDFRPEYLPRRDVMEGRVFLTTKNVDFAIENITVKSGIDGYNISFYIVNNGPECGKYPSTRSRFYNIGSMNYDPDEEFGITGIAVPQLCKGEKQKVFTGSGGMGILKIEVNPDYIIPESDYSNNIAVSTVPK